MLQRVVDRTAAAVDATWVILGAHAAQLAPLAAQWPASVLLNPHWAQGIASSIRVGVDHLPASCDGVMLVLADQALIGREDFRRLAHAWRRAPDAIAAACHGAVLGAPAIFPRRGFTALRRLKGDTGARALIAQHGAEVIAIPMPSAAFDLDTPEDLAAVTSAASLSGTSK